MKKLKNLIVFCLKFDDKNHLEIAKILFDSLMRLEEAKEELQSNSENDDEDKEDHSDKEDDSIEQKEANLNNAKAKEKQNITEDNKTENGTLQYKDKTTDDKKARILEQLEKFIGMTYNKLKIVDIAEVNEDKYKSLVVCQCECGNKVTARLKSVIYGEKKSCGCLSKKKKKETNKNKISRNVSTGGLDEVYRVYF